jgi:hypothetical protein
MSASGRFETVDRSKYLIQPELSRSCFYGSRHRDAVAHRVRVGMARRSTRGPCAAVRWGRQAA